MWNRKSWAVAIILGLALTMAGCLEFQLGDAETARVEDQYVGLWMQAGQAGGDGGLMAVQAFDKHAYLVQYFTYSKSADGKVEAKGEITTKMWLTPVNGATFLTAQAMDALDQLEKPKKPYYVAKIERLGDTVTMQSVKDDFVANAKVTDSAGLQKLLGENLNNPDAFADASSWEKVTAAKEGEAKAVLGAFHRESSIWK